MTTVPPVRIRFSQGTLLLEATPGQLIPVALDVVFDDRVKLYRAQAYKYARIIIALREHKIDFIDEARAYSPLELELHAGFAPRPHQQEAFRCWRVEAAGRAMIVMPTGSGKTYLAVMAINAIKRPALIVVPTIDLMQQWASSLEKFFRCKVGMLGGGSREIEHITVTTYDSAVIHMEFIGNRFGFVIFDECHHLPGPVNRTAASMCMAPYRLGLTATPDRDDGGNEIIEELIGPIAYQRHIDELEGSVLAPYITRRLELALEPDEAAEYQLSRQIYTGFLRRNGITFNQKSDWARFIGLCARQPDGRKALDAYLAQRRIARAGRSKFNKVWELICRHRGERIIVFTADNDTAYDMGRSFLLPVITHRTKAAERKEFLDNFRSGQYPVLITSKVLNEGVDVPEAGVGIIVSGSGSIREHVQRLGRILRAGEGKQAVLYELVSEGTSEVNVSERRREHRAYKNHFSYKRRF